MDHFPAYSSFCVIDSETNKMELLLRMSPESKCRNATSGSEPRSTLPKRSVFCTKKSMVWDFRLWLWPTARSRRRTETPVDNASRSQARGVSRKDLGAFDFGILSIGCGRVLRYFWALITTGTDSFGGGGVWI